MLLHLSSTRSAVVTSPSRRPASDALRTCCLLAAIIIFGATGTVGKELISVTQEYLTDAKIVAVGVDKDACDKLESEMKVHTMCKDCKDPKQVCVWAGRAAWAAPSHCQTHLHLIAAVHLPKGTSQLLQRRQLAPDGPHSQPAESSPLSGLCLAAHPTCMR
jgi:hypothetical protein